MSIFYNILHPTVDNDRDHRSEDEQVNGLGFYRTVNDGLTGLLVARKRFPDNPAFSGTSPADVDTEDANELRMQFTLPAKNYDFNYTFAMSDYGFTTLADLGAILAGGSPFIAQGIGHLVTHKALEDGSYATNAWEVEQLRSVTPTRDSRFAWGTYNWEGMNLYFLTVAGTVLTEPLRQDGVGFHSFYTLNNSAPHRNLLISSRFPGNDPTAFPVRSGHEVFCTQRWERAQASPHEVESDISELDITAGVYTASDQHYPDAGASNSEDVSGCRATHRWEIEQFEVEQTWYWMFVDNTLNSALGEAVEEDNDVPPPMDQVSVFQEHIFGSGDPNNLHYLYWSKRFKPESFPLDNYLEIGTENDPIRTHIPITGVLGVFTTQTKYRISGNNTSGFVPDEAVSHRGAPSPRSAVPTDKGVIFVARDGVFTTNFISPDQKISDAIDPIFYGETKNGYDPINWDAADQIAAGFYKNKYYFSYPSGVSTANDMTAVYSFDTSNWTFWDVGFNSFFAERDTDLFLAGGGDSLVYVIDDPATLDDDGANIAMELETKNFTGANHTTRNLFLYFKVDAECQDGAMTARFYVDDVLVQSHEITGSRTCELLSLPTETFGHRWRVKIEYTGNRRVSIFGVSSIFIPLMAS